MEYTTKLLYQSNYWYNDGLKRANIRDMSGAIASLKKSLQYNRENIAARNLLGLVYYGRGEVGEALVEWIISKNFRSHENIATYYIQKVQENAAELENINQSIRKYNQSLQYSQQNGEDMAIIQLKKVVAAHPAFLKAYQLLALLYLYTEQHSKARQVLKEAHKLDTTNDITLHYMHEMNQVRRTKTDKTKKREKQQSVTYNIGNETIIQPVSSSMKDHAGLMTLVNIGVGLLVGVAVMWFLIMPAANKSTADKTNKQVVAFSDEIAKQEAQVSALKKELEGYRATSEETEDVQETAASTMDSYEIVLNIYNHYTAEDMSDAAMVEELVKVNSGALGTLGRERYEEMTSVLYGRYGTVVYNTAIENHDAANYEEAISNLTLLMQMDRGFDDGKAMKLLSDAYAASGDEKNAKAWKERAEKEYPGAQDAKGEEDADDTNDTGETDTPEDTGNGEDIPEE